MFLLLLRDSFLLLIVLIAIPVEAEIFSSDGTYFFPTNISEEDCYFRAKNVAIKGAMEKAGLSYVVSSENLNCSEIKDKNTCEYFQDSQIYYEGGFITSKIFSNPQILFEGSISRKCSIHLIFPQVRALPAQVRALPALPARCQVSSTTRPIKIF